MNIFKKTALAVCGVLAVSALVILPQAQPASAAACHTTWGSLAKTSGSLTTDKITATRVGKHTCYDQLSIDLSAAAVPGYNARYVTRCIANGSGVPLPMRTASVIEIAVKANAASTFPANRTDLNNVSGFSAFRQIRGAGSFEGYTDICIANRARLPFTVFKTHNPVNGHGILVIRVAHSWA
jgi:hypothetical protein